MDSRELKKAILTQIEHTAEKVFGKKPEGLSLVYPPGVDMGDFACGCFPMAKQFRKAPNDIAQKLQRISLLVNHTKSGSFGPIHQHKSSQCCFIW
jgi:arginyl-tRNA synthetase